jgi:hypothetical protein
LSSNESLGSPGSDKSNKSLSNNRSQILLVAGAVIIIIFAIVIASIVQGKPEGSFSKIVSYGPVWNTDTWQCTSNSDFMLHGVLRGFENAEFAIGVTNIGTQSLYTFSYYGQTESFSIGAEAGQTITIARTGTVSGFLTLQTSTGSTASCIQI